MKDLMIDIETLDTKSTAVITQIGACLFDRQTGEIGDTFLVNLSVGDALMFGLTVNEETISWWRQQLNRSWLNSPIKFKTALAAFLNFCEKRTIKAVWSHATFDIPILTNAFRVCKLELPFHFRDCRDIRTLVDLAGISKDEMKAKTTAEKTHNALDDCIYQVEYCVNCFKKLKNEIS
jgi:oligoribonuclease (3'-5' exoribonuclease)